MWWAGSLHTGTKKRQHVGPRAEGGLWGCRCLGEIVGCNDGAVGEVWVDSLDWSPVKDTCTHIHTSHSTKTHTHMGKIIHTPTHTLMSSLVNPLVSMLGAQKLILPVWRALVPHDKEKVIYTSISLKSFLYLLIHTQNQPNPASTESNPFLWASLSGAHCRDTYRPSFLVISPTNFLCSSGGKLKSAWRLEKDQSLGRKERLAECSWAERHGWLWSMCLSTQQHLGFENSWERWAATLNGFKLRGMI